MKIAFFILAIALSIYWVYFKKDEDGEDEGLDPSVLKHFLKALGFCLMVFSCGWIIFKEGLFLWLAFYTGILLVLLIGLLERAQRTRIWIVGSVLLVFLFCGYRVPTHPGAFLDWVSENKQLYCPSTYDCVKVSTYVDENDHLLTKSEIVPITDSYTNWYLMFATGYFAYEDSTGKEVHYKGINIAGWWIETTD